MLHQGGLRDLHFDGDGRFKVEPSLQTQSPQSCSTRRTATSTSCSSDASHESFESILSLYQAFAGSQGKWERWETNSVDCKQTNIVANLRVDDGDGTSQAGRGQAKNSLGNDSINNSLRQSSDNSRDQTSDLESTQGEFDSDDEELSERSFSPPCQEDTPSNPLINFNSRRKKISAIFISAIAIWVYSNYKSRRGHRRKIKYRRQSETVRWIIRLLSARMVGLGASVNSVVRNIVRGDAAANLNKLKNAPVTPLAHLLQVARRGDVSKVMMRGSTLSYRHTMQSANTTPSHRWSKTTLPSNNSDLVQEIMKTLLNNGCDDITTLPDTLLQRFLKGPAVVALPFAYLGALYWMMRRLQRDQLQGDDDSPFSPKTRGSGHSATTFDDVAGIDSSVQELHEIVSYLKDPRSFHAIGARPPRGILLHGPPGCGKTHLARAIAGETERSGSSQLGGSTIDCFAVCSGSEFVETYVGRGAARVRTLFRNVREEALRNFAARQKSSAKAAGRGSFCRSILGFPGPVRRHSGEWEGVDMPMAILFIDEIDALAKSRNSSSILSSVGGCDEREQTLNQLLTELDGFETGSTTSQVNVIVIAATNRPEVLDPAILRPGRFDRHVKVDFPDARGREAILKVHARRIRLDSRSVDFSSLPSLEGFSGADLKNVINEAALHAVRTSSPAVNQSHLVDAVRKLRRTRGRPY